MIICRLQLLLLCCLIFFSERGRAQTGATFAPQIVFRSTTLSAGTDAVFFSATDRYAVVNTQGEAVIFDLLQKLEIRRVLTNSKPGFEGLMGDVLQTQQAAFDPDDQFVLLRSEHSLIRCSLQDSSDCESIVDDLAGGFDVGRHGTLVYLSSGSGLCVLRLAEKGACTPLPESVPAADKEGFDWRFVRISSDANKVALFGEIDRDVPNTLIAGRRRSDNENSQEEWRVSIYDLENRTLMDGYGYRVVPISVEDARFNRQGHLISCGEGASDSSAAAKTSPHDVFFPHDLFDVVANQKIGVTIQMDEPECLLDKSGQALFGYSRSGIAASISRYSLANGRKSTTLYSPFVEKQPTAGQVGLTTAAWISPTGQTIIYSVLPLGLQTAAAMYLYHPGSKAPSIALTGSVAHPTDIAFFPEGSTLITHGLQTRVWNFGTGTVFSSASNLQLSPDGLTVGWFDFDPQIKMESLRFQDRRNGNIRNANISLPKEPEWFGFSNGGNKVLLKFHNKPLIAMGAGQSKDLDCEPISLIQTDSNRHATISSNGSRFVTLCSRSDDDPKSDGLIPYLIVWDFSTLDEVSQINAEKKTESVAISPDGEFAALGGQGGFRLANLTTKTTKDITLTAAEANLDVNLIRFSPDGRFILCGVKDAFVNRGHLDVYDTQTDQLVPGQRDTSDLRDIAIGHLGQYAILKGDGTIDIYKQTHAKPILTLLQSGSTDWLAINENGLFDGTAGAFPWAGWRIDDNSPLITLDQVFDDLYSPGLLTSFFADTPESPPSDINLELTLRIPGLGALLAHGSLHPESRKNSAVLCFNSDDLAATIAERFGVGAITSNAEDTQCPRYVAISGGDTKDATLASLAALAKRQPDDTWHASRIIPTANSTLHVFMVSVGKYEQRDAIPSAEPSTSALRSYLKSQTLYRNIKFWGQDGCGKEMLDADATKAFIASCFQQMAQAEKPEDTVMIILIGHGGTVADNEMFYYLLSNFRDGPDDLRQAAISAADLGDAIRSLFAKKVILVVDACDAGAALDPLVRVAEARVKVAHAVADWSSKNGVQSSKNGPEEGFLLIAAASGVENVLGTEKENPFVEALLSAMKMASDSSGTVWAQAVAKSLDGMPVRVTSSAGASFTPVALAIGADFAVLGASTPNASTK